MDGTAEGKASKGTQEKTKEALVRQHADESRKSFLIEPAKDFLMFFSEMQMGINTKTILIVFKGEYNCTGDTCAQRWLWNLNIGRISVDNLDGSGWLGPLT